MEEGKKMELGVTCWSVNRSNLQLIKELGCNNLYSTVEWCNVHKAPDTYYWGQYDNEFRLEEELGIRSLRCILHTPLWASGIGQKNCTYRQTAYPPIALEHYGRFCAELVKRYPGREWVLWGEADNFPPREDPQLVQWAGDVKTYCDMMKYAYVEMKKADENCKVGLTSLVCATLNGEFPTVVENGKSLSKLEFFDQLLALGADDYCDFIPLDLYCYGYGNRQNFLTGIRKIKELMAKYRVKKPIYIAETGARISHPSGKIASRFKHEMVSEETQAGFLLYTYRAAVSANITKMFWHTLKDSDWGLIDRLNRKHLSYYSFLSIMRGILDDKV